MADGSVQAARKGRVACYQSLDPLGRWDQLAQQARALAVAEAQQDQLVQLEVAVSKALWVQPGPREILDRLGIQGPQDQQVQQVLARLALLVLLPRDQREHLEWAYLELLAQLVILDLPEQWVAPDHRAARALQDLLERLALPARVQLAQQETPAVQELWDRLGPRVIPVRSGRSPLPDRLAALAHLVSRASLVQLELEALPARRDTPAAQELLARQALQGLLA